MVDMRRKQFFYWCFFVIASVTLALTLYRLGSRSQQSIGPRPSIPEPKSLDQIRFGELKVMPLGVAQKVKVMVPGFGFIESVARPAECGFESMKSPMKFTAFFDFNENLVVAEYVRQGESRPAVDAEWSRGAYLARGEEVIAASKVSLIVVNKIFGQIEAFFYSDEVRFMKLAALKLRHSNGNRSGEEPKVSEVVVLSVYGKGMFPGDAETDGARYVFDRDGTPLWIDNVLGGE